MHRQIQRPTRPTKVAVRISESCTASSDGEGPRGKVDPAINPQVDKRPLSCLMVVGPAVTFCDKNSLSSSVDRVQPRYGGNLPSRISAGTTSTAEKYLKPLVALHFNNTKRARPVLVRRDVVRARAHGLPTSASSSVVGVNTSAKSLADVGNPWSRSRRSIFGSGR